MGARAGRELLLGFLFESVHFDLRACIVTENSLGFLCVLRQVQESEESSVFL